MLLASMSRNRPLLCLIYEQKNIVLESKTPGIFLIDCNYGAEMPICCTGAEGEVELVGLRVKS